MAVTICSVCICSSLHRFKFMRTYLSEGVMLSDNGALESGVIIASSFSRLVDIWIESLPKCAGPKVTW